MVVNIFEGFKARVCASGVALALAAGAASAQDYPAKPVRVIVPFHRAESWISSRAP
jgi:hypothetical protein